MRRYLFVLLITLNSCTDFYVYPTAHNVPHFKEKGEKDITVNISPLSQTLHTAYSLNDKFAVMLNLKNYSEKSDRKRELYGEAGFGYYKRTDEKTSYEVFVLGGFGNYRFSGWNSTDGPSGDKRFNTKNLKFAIQPSIGTHWKWGEAILSSKISMVNFYDFKGIMTDETPFKSILSEKTNFFYFEPAATLKLGSGPIRFQLQAQRSFPLFGKSISSFPILGVAGLNVRF